MDTMLLVFICGVLIGFLVVQLTVYVIRKQSKKG